MSEQTADVCEVEDSSVQSIKVHDACAGIPAQVWLLSLEFREGDEVVARAGIKWDREQKQFVFAGDEELVAPAARLFFDEVLAQAMDWLRPHI